MITGPEELLVDREADEIVAKLVKSQPDREVRELDCRHKAEPGVPGIAQDISNAAAPSLFGEPPILVVRAVDFADELTLDALKSTMAESEGPPMVITHNGAAKGRGIINAATKAGFTVQKSARPNERDLRRLMRAEATAVGGQLSDPAEHWLIEAIGTQSVALLLGAVRQAVSDSETGRVDEAAVQAMVPALAKVSAFKVVDLLWAGDVVAATKLLRQMEQQEKGVGVAVVAALAHGLRMMALAGLRGATPPSDMHLAPWQGDRARENARKWNATARKIAPVVAALPTLDAAMKGGLDGGIALDDEQKMAILEAVVTKLAAT